MDGTSLYSIIPREISKAIGALKNHNPYEKFDNSYKIYVEREKEYFKSDEFKEDKKYGLNILEDYEPDWYSYDLDMGIYELILS